MENKRKVRKVELSGTEKDYLHSMLETQAGVLISLDDNLREKLPVKKEMRIVRRLERKLSGT